MSLPSSVVDAARRGDAQAVMGAVLTDPNVMSAREEANGWTLLHFFARLSLVETVQQLIMLGCDTE
eukprot:5559616-Prymnesium_polylepis.1